MDESQDHQDWSRATELFYDDKLSLEQLRSIAAQPGLSSAERAIMDSTVGTENALRQKRENMQAFYALEQRLQKSQHGSLECLTVDLARNVHQIAGRFAQLAPDVMRADQGKPDDELKSLCDINCSLRYTPPGGSEQDLKLIRYLNNEWNLLVHRPCEDVVAIEIGGEPLTFEDGVFSLSFSDGDNAVEQRIASIVFQEMILTFKQGPQLAILFV